MPSIQAPVYTTYTRSEENEGTLKISDQKKKVIAGNDHVITSP